MRVLVVGAGVAGLCCALELVDAGATVDVIDRNEAIGEESCSWFAGGMLAPWCEGEAADPLVVRLGEQAMHWWTSHNVGVVEKGSLVVAQGRDRAELKRFARRTENHRWLDSQEMHSIEPELSDRFDSGLFFEKEAHMDPRAALATLAQTLRARGGRLHFGINQTEFDQTVDCVVDCRGLAARDELTDLRGVKGEMLLLHSEEFSIQRSVRLLHPRIPLYVVPRGDGIFMVGATMIESDDRKRITARSMIELLQGAYALHPALAEAEVVEVGCDVRPAFADNLPRIRRRGNTVYVNGFYRHGYLLAPSIAAWTKDVVMHDAYYSEVMDEHPMQQQAR